MIEEVFRIFRGYKDINTLNGDLFVMKSQSTSEYNVFTISKKNC